MVALDHVYECPVQCVLVFIVLREEKRKKDLDVSIRLCAMSNKQTTNIRNQNCAKQLCLNHDAVVVALDLVRECPVRACVCSAERGEEKEACGCFDEAQAICTS